MKTQDFTFACREKEEVPIYNFTFSIYAYAVSRYFEPVDSEVVRAANKVAIVKGVYNSVANRKEILMNHNSGSQ